MGVFQNLSGTTSKSFTIGKTTNLTIISSESDYLQFSKNILSNKLLFDVNGTTYIDGSNYTGISAKAKEMDHEVSITLAGTAFASNIVSKSTLKDNFTLTVNSIQASSLTGDISWDRISKLASSSNSTNGSATTLSRSDHTHTNFVHLTGDETISGNKTFNGDIKVNEKILFSNNTNPYIQMTTGGKTYYFQSLQGEFGLGPTWAIATRWDSNGTMTVHGGLVKSAKFEGELVGNAQSANKLTVNGGSSILPIYFKDGVPTPVDNKIAVSISGKADTAGTADNATKASQDEKGNIIHEKYLQKIDTLNREAEWLNEETTTSAESNSTTTDGIIYLQWNDVVKKIKVDNVANAGNATTAEKANKLNLTGNVGDENRPIYFNNGLPVASPYELNTTVPSDAKFTDTNTWRPIQYNGTSIGDSTTLNIKPGTNITIDRSSGTLTFNAKDTTYTASKGLVISSGDIQHTNNITAGTASEGGSNRSLTNGSTFKVPSIKYDSNGHITEISSTTLTAVDTWRGIQDNLTSSTNTTESLSAKQGYLLDQNKLDKTGGTITGALTIDGNLTVNGTTTTLSATNLEIKDKIIELNKRTETTAISGYTGFYINKYDGTNNLGFVFDNTGKAYLGNVSVDANNNLTNNGLKKIATIDNIPNLTNYVTTNTSQTISGIKTFTSETKFTNTSYAPTWSDIAIGLGKSSCFTRGAMMQLLTGQIIAPTAAYSDSTKGYNTEKGKIKFQTATASVGQPVVTDIAYVDSNGITLSDGKTFNGNLNWSYLTNIPSNILYGAKDGESYYGITLPSDDTRGYLRMPAEGILPNSSNTVGVGSIGSSIWQFKNIYGVTLYENKVSLAQKYAGINHNHDTVYVKLSGNSTISGTLTATSFTGNLTGTASKIKTENKTSTKIYLGGTTTISNDGTSLFVNNKATLQNSTLELGNPSASVYGETDAGKIVLYRYANAKNISTSLLTNASLIENININLPATSGTIALLSDITSANANVVTINTDQTISGEKTFSSNITLTKTGNETPQLIFQRGTSSDANLDWRLYSSTDGKLNIDVNNSGTWTNIVKFSNDGEKAMYVDKVVATSIDGNLKSTASTSNVEYKMAFLNPLSNYSSLYYDSEADGKFTFNPSTETLTLTSIKDSVTTTATLTPSKLTIGDISSTNGTIESLTSTTGNITTLTSTTGNITTLNSTDIVNSNKVSSTIVETGSTGTSYFQTQRLRGEGTADSYYHAIDFGFKDHDSVDFYEYGGTWNFWTNTTAAKTTDIANQKFAIIGNKINTRNIEPYITDTYNIGTSSLKYKEIHASSFKGNADTASALKLSGRVGSATQPAWINASGVPQACTYNLLKSVPANAKFDWRTVQVNGVSIGADTTLNLKPGNNITIDSSSGTVTFNATNTTYTFSGNNTNTLTITPNSGTTTSIVIDKVDNAKKVLYSPLTTTTSAAYHVPFTKKTSMDSNDGYTDFYLSSKSEYVLTFDPSIGKLKSYQFEGAFVGNATSATTANNLLNFHNGYAESSVNPDKIVLNGFWEVQNTNSGTHPAGIGAEYRILSTGENTNNEYWHQQIATDYYNDKVFYRRSNGTAWQSWKEFMFKDDLGTTLDGYLPLSGGTMTGMINVGQGNNKGINLGTNGLIGHSTGNSTSDWNTFLGVYNGDMLMGHSKYPAKFRGKNDHPTYTDGNNVVTNMALITDVPTTEYLNQTYVKTSGDENISGIKTFTDNIVLNATNNANGKAITWKTVSSKNPYIGYATNQTDGTFVISIESTDHSDGLAIGGSSGNLLWKGNQVATSETLKSYYSTSGGTLSGNIHISKSATNDVSNTSTNPQIRFSASGNEPVALIYNNSDTYRSPAGIKVVGSQGGEWFEAPSLYADKLTVSGNSTLGDANTDTLIVNAKSTFNAESTFSDVVINNSLTVKGTITSVNSQTVSTSDKLIELYKRDDTTSLVGYAGIMVNKYDGTNAGALVFDNTGTAYVGDVTITNNDIVVGTGDKSLQPLLTRDPSGLTDGQLIKWDSTKNCAVSDTGTYSKGITAFTGENSDSTTKGYKLTITDDTGSKEHIIPRATTIIAGVSKISNVRTSAINTISGSTPSLYTGIEIDSNGKLFTAIDCLPASDNGSTNRNENTLPSDYSSKVFRVRGIRNCSYLKDKNESNKDGSGSIISGNYAHIIGWSGWSDQSGGGASELAMANGKLYFRTSASQTQSTGTWNSWKQIINDTDTQSIAGTKTFLTPIKITSNNVTLTMGSTASGTTHISSTAPFLFNNNIKVIGNILPNVSNTYELGSSSLLWKSLYVGGDAKLNNVVTNNITMSGTTGTINFRASTATAGTYNDMATLTYNTTNGVTFTLNTLNSKTPTFVGGLTGNVDGLIKANKTSSSGSLNNTWMYSDATNLYLQRSDNTRSVLKLSATPTLTIQSYDSSNSTWADTSTKTLITDTNIKEHATVKVVVTSDYGTSNGIRDANGIETVNIDNQLDSLKTDILEEVNVSNFVTKNTAENIIEKKSFGQGVTLGNNTTVGSSYDSTGCTMQYNSDKKCVQFIFA